MTNATLFLSVEQTHHASHYSKPRNAREGSKRYGAPSVMREN